MRKILSVISVLLALTILVPMCAFAEPATAYVFEISDPILSVDDTPFFDLTELTVQMMAAVNADSTRMQYALDVYGGDEAIANLVADVINGSDIYAQITGMTSVYAASVQAMSELGGELAGDDADMAAIEEMLSMFAEWSLPAKISEVAGKYAEAGLDTENATVETAELNGGAIDVYFTPFSPDMNAYMTELCALLDSDPIVNQIISAMAIEEGYDTMPRMSDAYASAFSDIQLSGNIGASEDGLAIIIDITMQMTSAEGEKMFADFTMISDATGETDSDIDMALTFRPEDEDSSIDFVLTGSSNDDGMYYELNGVSTAAGESTSILTSSFEVGAADESTYAATFAFSVPDEIDFAVSGSYNIVDGQFAISVAAVDGEETATIAFSFAPEAELPEDAVFSGGAAFMMSDGISTYDLTAHVAMYMAEIDTDVRALDTANVIDLTTMTDETNELLTNEMSVVLINIITGLERTVPGLEGISDALFGTDEEVPAEEIPADDTTGV